MTVALPYGAHTPFRSPPSVDKVYLLPSEGLFSTKSGGVLSVLLTAPLLSAQGSTLDEFFTFDSAELASFSHDVRALRLLAITGLKQGAHGGEEFHRARTTLLFPIRGSVDLTVEDVYGKKMAHRLDLKNGASIPPFIFHGYTVVEQDTSLVLLANTRILPNDPQSSDSYGHLVFECLRSQYSSSASPST